VVFVVAFVRLCRGDLAQMAGPPGAVISALIPNEARESAPGAVRLPLVSRGRSWSVGFDVNLIARISQLPSVDGGPRSKPAEPTRPGWSLGIVHRGLRNHMSTYRTVLAAVECDERPGIAEIARRVGVRE
jgi:hypothetical protein